ncbi:hypothetical protein KKJ13_13115 [Xenorhabdus bovienii]|uniref:hypothetical protein n=1 Tax=Xenorhabdus bovienii TaxID=40576 RepID=UPI0023B293CA|nr:hypothetical protein [Xenorhabdus bovienii]MDE9442523.1 hypothetical protein [Xenorhabdus bovienii]
MPESVAGAPLAGSMPPAPAERAPAARQAGRRSPVGEKGATLKSVYQAKRAFRGKKCVRAFWVQR